MIYIRQMYLERQPLLISLLKYPYRILALCFQFPEPMIQFFLIKFI